jgi:hypothetical protein
LASGLLWLQKNKMITIENSRQLALSLAGVEEHDHFGKPAFKTNKRIFATLWIPERRMMVKLCPIDQSVFNAFDPAVFYPVPNKWGLGGSTFVELDKVRSDKLEDALKIAWQGVTSKGKK